MRAVFGWKVLAVMQNSYVLSHDIVSIESRMNSLQSIFEGVTFTNNDQVLQILQDEGVSLHEACLYTSALNRYSS